MRRTMRDPAQGATKSQQRPLTPQAPPRMGPHRYASTDRHPMAQNGLPPIPTDVAVAAARALAASQQLPTLPPIHARRPVHASKQGSHFTSARQRSALEETEARSQSKEELTVADGAFSEPASASHPSQRSSSREWRGDSSPTTSAFHRASMDDGVHTGRVGARHYTAPLQVRLGLDAQAETAKIEGAPTFKRVSYSVFPQPRQSLSTGKSQNTYTSPSSHARQRSLDTGRKDSMTDQSHGIDSFIRTRPESRLESQTRPGGPRRVNSELKAVGNFFAPATSTSREGNMLSSTMAKPESLVQDSVDMTRKGSFARRTADLALVSHKTQGLGILTPQGSSPPSPYHRAGKSTPVSIMAKARSEWEKVKMRAGHGPLPPISPPQSIDPTPAQRPRLGKQSAGHHPSADAVDSLLDRDLRRYSRELMTRLEQFKHKAAATQHQGQGCARAEAERKRTLALLDGNDNWNDGSMTAAAKIVPARTLNAREHRRDSHDTVMTTFGQFIDAPPLPPSPPLQVQDLHRRPSVNQEKGFLFPTPRPGLMETTSSKSRLKSKPQPLPPPADKEVASKFGVQFLPKLAFGDRATDCGVSGMMDPCEGCGMIPVGSAVLKRGLCSACNPFAPTQTPRFNVPSSPPWWFSRWFPTDPASPHSPTQCQRLGSTARNSQLQHQLQHQFQSCLPSGDLWTQSEMSSFGEVVEGKEERRDDDKNVLSVAAAAASSRDTAFYRFYDDILPGADA